MQVNKWDFEKHKYKKVKISDKCSKYEDSLDKIIKCANCGKNIKAGDGYTSKQYHDDIGLGYIVCSECNAEEIYLYYTKNQYTQIINGVEHHLFVEK